MIEKGCKARVVGANNSTNNGKVVEVGDYLGAVSGFKNTELWTVDVPQIYHTEEGIEIQVNMCPEQNLRRIDDDEPSWEQIEAITGWKPGELVVT